MFKKTLAGAPHRLMVGFSAFVALSLFGLTPAAAQKVATPPAPAPAASAPAPPVKVVLEQFKVQRDSKGQETLVAADFVRPSDTIEYRAVYKNVSKATVKGVVANLPVPEGVSYVPSSSWPAGAQVATVDARYGAEPLKRTVKGPDGKPRLENVPYAEYRAIRWSLGAIEPGKEIQVKARVLVDRLPTAEEIASAATQTQQAINAAKALSAPVK